MSGNTLGPTLRPAAPSLSNSQGPSSGPTRAVVFALFCLLTSSAWPHGVSGQEPWHEELSLSVGMGPTTGAMAWQIAAFRHLSSTREVGLRLLGSVAILGNESAHDLAMHFGLRTTVDGVWLGMAAGPSLTWTSERECLQFSGGFFGCERHGPIDRTWGGGASGQTTLGWRRASFAIVAGMNTTASYGGVIVSLHLGRVPKPAERALGSSLERCHATYKNHPATHRTRGLPGCGLSLLF